MTFRFIFALLISTVAFASDIEAMWDFDHPNDSEVHFRAELANAMANHDVSQAGELRTQIARAQAMQGDFKLANSTLDELRDELPTMAPVVSVRYTLERGRIAQATGEKQRAWRWYHAALVEAQKNNLDFFVIDAMHMLALAESGQGALDWNLKAIALAEHSHEEHADDWLGSLYNNVGWLYHDAKNDEKALAYLRQAQAWHEAHGSDRPLLIARWGVAKLLRLTGEPEKALAIQLDLERAWREHHTEDAYVFEEIAEDMRALGQIDDAKRYYGKAYDTFAKDAWFVKRDAAHLARLKQLATSS